ncbi:MAG: FAD-dependent thymidylate synthase [Candidatus Gastranaerophilales bacterium]|nr:FAD-dependent thymidylate synthase [Candidatus Gastranaerophilales bacterium]
MENAKQVEVKVISKPQNMLKTVYTACRTCYSADSPINIYESEKAQDEDKMLKLITRVISSGHYSTIEHIQVSFAINNISRACSHQLVRHRHMSFSQKSQRYVKEKGQFDYIIPPTVESNPELTAKFNKFMEKISDFYQELVEAGVPAEDARFVLPNASVTSMVASLNLRELIHLANLRLCTRAQKEIRILVKKMCDELVKEEPWLKDYLVPKCERLGFCDEDKSCGRLPIKELALKGN